MCTCHVHAAVPQQRLDDGREVRVHRRAGEEAHERVGGDGVGLPVAGEGDPRGRRPVDGRQVLLQPGVLRAGRVPGVLCGHHRHVHVADVEGIPRRVLGIRRGPPAWGSS